MTARDRTGPVIALLVVAALAGAAFAATAGAAIQHERHTTRTCAAPALAGTVVQARLLDMGAMMGPEGWGRMRMMRVVLDQSVLPAGVVSFEVRNLGERRHELLVLPLPAGRPGGARAVGPDGTVDESGSLGEASRTCAGGAGHGIASGSTGWVTTTLAPGRYEALCNLPWHYAAGMYAVFTVR